MVSSSGLRFRKKLSNISDNNLVLEGSLEPFRPSYDEADEDCAKGSP